VPGQRHSDCRNAVSGDVELVCEECKGKRFKSSVLEVQYKSKNIAEVLDLTVHEALEFFAGKSSLISQIAGARGNRSGILRLGQSATSSQWRSQRIKLAAFISVPALATASMCSMSRPQDSISTTYENFSQRSIG